MPKNIVFADGLSFVETLELFLQTGCLLWRHWKLCFCRLDVFGRWVVFCGDIGIVFADRLSFVETLETLFLQAGCFWQMGCLLWRLWKLFFADGMFFVKSFVTLSLQTGCLLLRML